MPLPPVPIEYNSEYFVSGDVTIHETAVIAPGVILQAAPHSQIILREGACLGKGTILNAYAGIIEIESGAILGAGVLIIGRVTIGKDACIGAATSIFNTSVDSLTMSPSGSLLGDNSRNWQPNQALKDSNSQSNIKTKPKSEAIPSPWDEDLVTSSSSPEINQINDKSPSVTDNTKISAEIKTDELPTTRETETSEFVSPVSPEQSGSLQKHSVIGRAYINQLLIGLFPEREAFKKTSEKF